MLDLNTDQLKEKIPTKIIKKIYIDFYMYRNNKKKRVNNEKENQNCMGEEGRKSTKVLPIDRFPAGNVQNMLYISCCPTASPLSHALSHVLPMCFSFSHSKRSFALIAGPYHLHMPPLEEASPPIPLDLPSLSLPD